MIKDLGELSRVFLFGGPYSNLQATAEVMKIAKNKGFSGDQIICTGDTVAYCGQPNETLRVLNESRIHILKGNVEESLIQDSDECGCNFIDGSVCDTLSAKWYQYLKKNVDLKYIEWMREFPDFIKFQWQGKSFLVVHGSFSHINEFIYYSTPLEKKISEVLKSSVDVIVGGHCGLPFAQSLGEGKYWLNPGVVGLPPNDGTQKGWYGVLDSSFNCISFNYSTDETIGHMDGKLPEEYIKALHTGLWPSLDILPEVETNNQGRIISEFSLEIST